MEARMIVMMLSLLAGAAHGAKELTIAVASNMRFAMEEIRMEFQRKSPVEVKAIYGSSGKLAVQIRSGAPFEVFVSADRGHPDSLIRWGFAAGPNRTYAYGKLVLWTIKDLDLSRGIRALTDSGIGRIAVADSGRAPYGVEAMKALGKAGLRESLSGKLIFGESIGQVDQYILTGNADAGFTAKSTVMAGEMAEKGKWVEVDAALYDRIAQGAVVCKRGQKQAGKAAAEFLDFLYGESAGKILKKYGYDLP